MKTPPWIKNRKRSAPELLDEPPIWLRDHSNGEYYHFQTTYERKLRKFILEKADENARKVGIARRDFLASAMGMATSLYCINIVSACSDKGNTIGHNVGNTDGDGGPKAPPRPEVCKMYDIEPDEMFDESAACAKLSGNEFIFDIQTHFFEHKNDWEPAKDPNYVSWEQTNPGYVTILSRLAGANYGMANYLDVLFCKSDTKMAVLSCWPGALCTPAAEMMFGANPPCGLPMSTEGAAEARDFINKMAESQRLLSHAMILPNDPAGIDFQLEIMERVACTTGVGAWKLYPAWGPSGTGFFLDDATIGIPVIEKGIKLGFPNFCIHKGLPIPGFDSEHNRPMEIGKLAAAYPDGNFIIYHSSINANGSTREGPYVEGDDHGVNALITSMRNSGIGPNQNVFGELGSSWRQVMNDATQAAHYLGKLLKYVGENNILWGTDSMVGGTPQPQIEALRAATIPKDLQDQYGYPELTADIKAKIFGLNSAVVYKVDPEKRHCNIEKCAMTSFKEQIDEEMGKRRWTLTTPPMGPRTYEEYVEHGKEAIARGVPG